MNLDLHFRFEINLAPLLWSRFTQLVRMLITFPQSQLEARLLFCPVFFGGDQEARPLCPRQMPDRRQSADHISVLVCPLFRSNSLSFAAS